MSAMALLIVLAVDGPTLYPIYAHLPGSAHNTQAQRLFAEASARLRLPALEVMDIPEPPPPRAPNLLRRMREEPAVADEAVAEVMRTGGAGLNRSQLADLFLQQAATHMNREAFLRAAVLAPDRVLEGPRWSPAVIAAFKSAAAEVAHRPTGAITVKAGPKAEIVVDGGPTQLSPAAATALPYGEHFLRVTEVGRQPWSAVVSLTDTALPVDAPATAPLTLDLGQAAAHARRINARFALVATLVTNTPMQLSLDLVDADTGQKKDSAVIPFASEAPVLEAAVMRLDEEARQLALGRSRAWLSTVPVEPDAPGPRFGGDPGGWARAHWPLLTAVGVAVATAVLLGVAVATDTHP
jgi:hypothetical protein